MLVLLVAAWLRFHTLVQDTRFHPDEALFATFARKAAVQGDWLLHGTLDKTPLTIYASAVSMTLWGVTPLPNGVVTLDVHAGEFAARVPNVFASIVLVAVMAALVKRLYLNSVEARRAVPLPGILVSWLMALSPFAIAFSATAFTDGLMLLFVVLALWMAAARRPLWAGIWLALGFACKQQAAFYLPLVLLLGWGVSAGTRTISSLPRFLLPLAFMFVLLLIWDTARAQPISLWALAAANNDPGRLIRSDEVLSRLSVWLGYGEWVAGWPVVTAFLCLIAVAAFVWRVLRQPRRRSTVVDVLLIAYLLSYFLLHWLVAFNTYDRYLLLVLPLVLLLIGQGISWVIQVVGARRAVPLRFFVLVVAFLNILPALNASNGYVPVGGDFGKHAGIDVLADYLNAKPLGTIIYDHWLGWELGYYMGAWSDKRRVYYPTPGALAAYAHLQPDPAPRYFPVPADQSITPWLDALRSASFEVSLVYDDGRFRVYELIPPHDGAGA